MRRLGIFDDKSAVVAWRAGTAVPAAQLASDVATLALRFSAGRHVLNLATDRYAFMVGFLAAAATGRICLLPPTRVPSALAQLHARYPDAVALIESDASFERLPAIRIETGTRTPPIDFPDLRDEVTVAAMFTSGSTGEPAPHAKTWGSLLGGARALRSKLARRGIARGCVVGTVPPQHMYGFEATVMLPLASGWQFHSACPLLPADLHEACAAVPAPVILATTPLHLRAVTAENLALPGITCAISSTMPLARTLACAAEGLFGAPLLEIYGCTETGAIATRRTAMDDVWQPLEGVRISVDGTAWCVGGHVEHPVRLADRLRATARGGFVLEGRVGDMVKIAGKRASLTALNSMLIAVPGVVDGVFFSPLEDSTGHARLGAIVVAPEVDDQAIFARLAQHIDAAFLPRPLYRVDALPREASGKLPIERVRALVARLQAAPAREER